MNDNFLFMRRLFIPILLVLSLTACPSGFSPAGGSRSSAGNTASVAGTAGGGEVPDGQGSGPDGTGLRPKADPEFIYPKGSGGTAVVVSAFRAFDGPSLSRPLDPNTPANLPAFDGSASLTLLVQAETGTADSQQWVSDLSGRVRVLLARTGSSQNEYAFCDAPILPAADGSNVTVGDLEVQPGSLQLYYRSSPTPAAQWVDCAVPVSFSSIGPTAYQDFIGDVNPIEYLGSYRITARPPPPSTGGTGTGGLPE